ncbi:MAG: hypothetical protein ACI4MS_06310 [Candidatus Coproplasma sp.]
MSDFYNDGKRGDSEIVLERLEKFGGQIASIDARLNNVLATVGANYSAGQTTIAKITEESEKLKTEVRYLSAQLESVCITLAKSIQKIADEVAEIKNRGVNANIDVDDLSSSVASKIIIPDTAKVDTDELASKLSGMQIDYDSLGYSVAKNMYIPQVVAEEFNYDELADKLISKMPEPAPAQVVDLDYGMLGVNVAKNLIIPQAVAEELDYEELSTKIVEKLPEQEVKDIDYGQLGVSVAKNLIIPQAVAEELDYEELSTKIVEKLPEQEVKDIDYGQLGVSVAKNLVIPQALAEEIDYNELASKIAQMSPEEQLSSDYIASKVAEQIVIPTVATSAEIDIEELADKIAERIVAEQPVEEYVEEYAEEPEEEQLATMTYGVEDEEVETADSYETQEYVEETNAPSYVLNEEAIVEAIIKGLSEKIDSDEIADAVAKKVGSVSPEEFEITVDDDGCDSIAKSIESKFDYDALASAVAEKLNPAIMAVAESEANIDAEELANSISEKLSVTATVNEDALAEKSAAILSNFMPEVDNADIADKIIAGIIPAIPNAPVLDGEQIADSVSERLLQNQEESDYDIVIDEEGVSQITENIKEELTKVSDERYEKVEEEIATVKEEYGERFDNIEAGLTEVKDENAQRCNSIEENIATVKESNDARFNKIDEDIEEVKNLLLSGAVVSSVQEEGDYDIVIDEEGVNQITENIKEELTKVSDERYDKVEEEIATVKEEYSERFNKIDEDIAEIKNLLLSGAVVSAVQEESVACDEALVTVSDVVSDEEECETQSDEVIDEIVGDIDENPSEGEIMPDGLEGEGGVDFANMMKYNRSFIARIIQGTDEQKNYYGQVKTALLSYKKVNSNVAWGAERFNKGRETIARFKIRGKTLCLYLALNPAEYALSVYHHADVSDNKSMHGTPMMVKIKSPLGVKKAIRLIDEMMEMRNGEKRHVAERDYAAMYPYETMDELIEDGLVKDVSKK